MIDPPAPPAAQRRERSGRRGRTEHTVSVMPKQEWDAEASKYVYAYRAACTCGKRSLRVPTLFDGEEWARVHREIVNGMPAQRPSAGQPAISASETTTDSLNPQSGALRADEGA